MKQEQFLDVVTLEEARRRWDAALDLAPRPSEIVPLCAAHGRVLAEDVTAPGDVPAFDRSNVDGFAVRAADTFGAQERTPRILRLVGEAIDAGHAPQGEVASGEARVIATGGVVPRGADAIVMVEDTEIDGACVHVKRPVPPGGRISAAGGDMARGEIVLRRGTVLTARETGTLAACGIDRVPCVGVVRVAIVSTGDELVAPGTALLPGQVHDANATLLADALREMGAEPHVLGIARDDGDALRAILAQARTYDAVLLSGGTSKGSGDLSYRVLAEHAKIIAHGVALKPGKPLCLAAWDRKPVAVLPGFPTSAIFTFHAAVAPVLRRLLGRREQDAPRVAATLPGHVQSETGRREFNLVHLLRGRGGWVAFPLGKGSGSVTTFARADGFFDIPADMEYVEAGETVEVTLLGRDVHPADLVIVGSHCLGVDRIASDLSRAGFDVKQLATGSRGGVEAAHQGACDLAPVHLYDAATGTWNDSFAPAGVRVLRGYGRRLGLAWRPEHDACFAQGEVDAVLRAALADPAMRIANRNPASGTFLQLEAFRAGGGEVPPGWHTRYTSHTAVAAAIERGSADYGLCLERAARVAGLAWRAWSSEQLDFLVPEDRWDRPAMVAFRRALQDETMRAALRTLGLDA